MLNLSPISREEALLFAREEADQLIATPKQLAAFLQTITDLLVFRKLPLASVRERVETMVCLIERHLTRSPVNSKLLKEIDAALVYLRNPYDQYFDDQAAGGWDDDIEVIQSVKLPKC